MSKKTLKQLVFRLLWTLTRKSCIFTERFSSRLSKLLSTCPEEQFQSTISERKSRKLQDFRIIFEVSGQWRKTFSGLAKQQKMSRGTAQRKSFLKGESFAFSDSERFSYFWRKTLPDLRKSQSTYTWKFLGKNIFWTLINVPHLFELWSKKRSVGKFFHEMSQLYSARPEAFFD